MDIRGPLMIWPGWETVRLLGRGSFGEVYEIRRSLGALEEHAAVKVLTIPQSQSEIDELRMSGYDDASLTRHFDDMKDRLLREYATMATLKGSTNIVYCDDLRTERRSDTYGWILYIKMELLTPLANVLGSGLPEEQTLRLGRDIARALAACHREKIIHRDVKPQNIFVNRDGTFKLGDFGIARTMEGSGSASARTGTYRYMAPEVYNAQHYGARADIYSLGLVLYWLLNNGRAPFVPAPPCLPSAEEESQAMVRRFAGEPLPPPAHGSEEFQRIVLKACAFDPAERYRSAEEMLRELDRLDRGFPAAALPRGEAYGRTPFPAAEVRENEDTSSSTTGLFSQRPQPSPARMPQSSPARTPERSEIAPLPPWETNRPARQERPGNGRSKSKPLLISLIALLAVAAAVIVLLVSGVLPPKGGEITVEQTSEPSFTTVSITMAPSTPTPEPALTPTPDPGSATADIRPSIATPDPSSATVDANMSPVMCTSIPSTSTSEPTPEPLSASVTLRGSASFEEVPFFDAEASSWLEQDNRYFFYPRNVITPDSIDPWTEGVDGQGINEALTLYFDRERTIQHLSLRLGYANNESLFVSNSRPSKLRISFSDGSSVVCNFRDTSAEQLVTLNQPVRTDRVVLTILDVYPGTEFDDTCIFKVYAFR